MATTAGTNGGKKHFGSLTCVLDELSIGGVAVLSQTEQFVVVELLGGLSREIVSQMAATHTMHTLPVSSHAFWQPFIEEEAEAQQSTHTLASREASSACCFGPLRAPHPATHTITQSHNHTASAWPPPNATARTQSTQRATCRGASPWRGRARGTRGRTAARAPPRTGRARRAAETGTAAATWWEESTFCAMEM